jgi:ribonuclease P protein component
MQPQGVEPVQATRVGFVVSRAVGSSVVRSGVKRRLRAVMRARVPELGPGLLVVVRANPAAAGINSARLAADLDAGLSRALTAVRSAGLRDGTATADGSHR